MRWEPESSQGGTKLGRTGKARLRPTYVIPNTRQSLELTGMGGWYGQDLAAEWRVNGKETTGGGHRNDSGDEGCLEVDQNIKISVIPSHFPKSQRGVTTGGHRCLVKYTLHSRLAAPQRRKVL